MNWLDDILSELAVLRAWGYHPNHPSSSEPASLVALALLAHGRTPAAQASLDWLADLHGADGSIGVFADQEIPGWPTCLAVLAWRRADESSRSPQFQSKIDRSVAWILGLSGKGMERHEDMGHDTTLIGWPWVDGTHSWVEPTAFAVLALKATGNDSHPRNREAVRLLVDRLLPDGGCNYGNTYVLGQYLRMHVQPSGIALLALADEEDPSGRLSRTIDLLTKSLSPETTTASLTYALLGLGAQNAVPPAADTWLATAAKRTLHRDPSPYKLALLALAAAATEKPLNLLRHEVLTT